MRELLEWLTGMGLLFYGWLIPLTAGYAYVKEYNGNIIIGILRATVVVTAAGFTKQAIELSEKVNVSLFAFDDYFHEFKPMNRCARSLLSILSH